MRATMRQDVFWGAMCLLLVLLVPLPCMNQQNQDVWYLDYDYSQVMYSKFSNGTTMFIAISSGFSLDVLDPHARKVSYSKWPLPGVASQMAISPFNTFPLTVSLYCISYNAKVPSQLAIMDIERETNITISLNNYDQVVRLVTTPSKTCIFTADKQQQTLSGLYCFSHKTGKAATCSVDFPKVTPQPYATFGYAWYQNSKEKWVYMVWQPKDNTQKQFIYKYLETEDCLEFQRLGPKEGGNDSIVTDITILRGDNQDVIAIGSGSILTINSDEKEDMKLIGCLNMTCGSTYYGIITQKPSQPFTYYATNMNDQPQYNFIIEAFSWPKLSLENVYPYPKGNEPSPDGIWYDTQAGGLYTTGHYWDYGINGSAYGIGFTKP